MKRYLILSVLCLTILSCENKDVSPKQSSAYKTMEAYTLPDSLSSDRVKFVVGLRDVITNDDWPDFNQYSDPFIYFNKNKSEVFFPTTRVIQKLDDFTKFSDDYLVTQRTDTIPFHFEVMISFNQSDSSKFYFEHPVQQVLSVEETTSFIPSVQTTEMWSTMVIHEMFHQFQYDTPSYRTYAKNDIGVLPYDIRDLMELSHGDEAFLQAIQNENNYLLNALDEEEDRQIRAHLEKYLQSREERISMFFSENDTLETVENYYVLQEGSARYAEYLSMIKLSELSDGSETLAISDDTRFNNFNEFNNFDLSHPDFSYLTYAGASDYHYALGFNALRVLDKLDVDYKSTLLDNPHVPIHHYIDQYLRSHE